MMAVMTPLRARLTFIAFTGLCFGTAMNALFLQQEPQARAGQGPTTAVSITQFGPSGPLETGRFEDAAGRSAAADPAPPSSAREKLKTALVREFVRKGYDKSLAVSPRTLAPMVLVYEYDSGLPLTGEASETLLKRLIFDLNPAPRGPFADRAESDRGFVLEVQNALLGLGFFSGTLSGRMDAWTQNAVKAFQHHRRLPDDGRLTEATILELIAYSGQPLRRS